MQDVVIRSIVVYDRPSSMLAAADPVSTTRLSPDAGDT
jgi:hypothetical protein